MTDPMFVPTRPLSPEEQRARAEDPAFTDLLDRARARVRGELMEQPVPQRRPVEWAPADFADAVARVCRVDSGRVLGGTPEKLALARQAGRARNPDYNRESY